jgi:hypothetical protein
MPENQGKSSRYREVAAFFVHDEEISKKTCRHTQPIL